MERGYNLEDKTDKIHKEKNQNTVEKGPYLVSHLGILYHTPSI